MITKTLYVLALRGTVTDSLFMLYCTDATEADEMSRDLEKDYGASRVSLQAHPRGFRIVTSELPGVVTVPEDE